MGKACGSSDGTVSWRGEEENKELLLKETSFVHSELALLL
jgi:hypothetical protein